MTKTQYEIDINTPVDKVYNCYNTDPQNIKDARPVDTVKESELLSMEKNEVERSQMKVKAEYIGERRGYHIRSDI